MKPLFKHQQKTVDFCRDHPRVFDASDPGTGKTRAAIEMVTDRLEQTGRAALVLCPKSLVRSAWEADIDEYAPDLKVSCAFAHNRERAFTYDAEFYVTNHDAAKWLARQKPGFFDRFSTLIIDESGAYKHHTSQRSRAVNKIRKYFEFRHNMNGTPNANCITHLWNQYFILDDGERLGPQFSKFRSVVCVPEQTGPQPNMVKWIERDGASDAVSKCIEDITIRHELDKCIDIPPNHEYSVPYALTGKQLKVYRDFEAEGIALLQDAKISAVNKAAVVIKMMQAASGAVYDENGNYHLIDTARYEAVMDKVEERQYSVVFFQWKHQKDQLMAEARRRKMTYCLIDGTVTDDARYKAVKDFQAGLHRICFAHPKSAAHGLTLTRGTAVIWASPTSDAELYLQGLRRITRPGQTSKTETITFVAPDTIEEDRWQSRSDRSTRMTDLLDKVCNRRDAPIAGGAT